MREKYMVLVVSMLEGIFKQCCCTELETYCADWDLYGFNGEREYCVLVPRDYLSSDLYVWSSRII